MNLGIIGTGARAQVYLKLCTSGIREQVTLRAVADVNPDKMKLFCEGITQGSQIECYTDYQDLLKDECIDAVFICTPDTTHREIAVAAVAAGKHVLLEKPIATSMEDAAEIYKAVRKHGKVFRMGFVLRYTDIYRKIKDIVRNGELGKLITIEAKEMLGYLHGGSFFRRWHRFRANNGGFLNAKCSHDMDLLTWIANEDPLYISSFGSRTYFNKKENAASNCRDCSLKNDCRYYYRNEDYGVNNSTEDICVYNSDKDIVDHQIVGIEYHSGLTLSFTVSTLSAKANRIMTVFGSEATLIADFEQNRLEIKSIFPESTVVYQFGNAEDGHGGGDRGMFTDFIDGITNWCDRDTDDARSGMISTAISQAAELSMLNKEIVHLPKFLRNYGIEMPTV